MLVRPVRPGDKELLLRGFERLSPVSRYHRFLGATARLSAEQVRYFTEVDQRDHLAWLALDLSDPARPGLGIARCIRLAERPRAAEVAITVVDSHQRKGLGTILLGVLARAAIAQGIDTWVAWVLTDNAPMLDVFHQLGARDVRLRDGVIGLEIRVPDDPAALPDTPAGRVFRQTARIVGTPRAS